MSEGISMWNKHDESGVFRRGLEVPSIFLNFEGAVDHVVVALHFSDQPVIDQPLIDAIVSWLQPQNTEESRSVLQQIRERWIEPYAMTGDDELYQKVVFLSDILSDPVYAQTVLRSMHLESQMRTSALPKTNIPNGEASSKHRGVVSFHEDDTGHGTDPSARAIYKSFVGIKPLPLDVPAKSK